MKGRKPTVDEQAFMDKVCSLGCIVCLIFREEFSPCSFHHIDGRVKEGAHYHGIGLCGPHHQIPDLNKPPQWATRHVNKTEFEETYWSEQELYFKVLELIGEDRTTHTATY